MTLPSAVHVDIRPNKPPGWLATITVIRMGVPPQVHRIFGTKREEAGFWARSAAESFLESPEDEMDS